MNIIQLDYCSNQISVSREAWFNATEIAAMFGKRPIDWLRLPETERYIEALMKREAVKVGNPKVRFSHFAKTRRGGCLSYRGTWLHPKLAVAFARWCDIDFAVWCDEQITTMLMEQPKWKSERKEASIGYKVMSEILQIRRKAEGKETKSYHYSNEARLINAALTGKFKPLNREVLSMEQVKMLAALEVKNTVLIAQGKSYNERKANLFLMAESIRAANASTPAQMI
ncbi:KilA-N domain-containing protein [Neisseria subflava]|uniref:KilA-N domain-containing protein n=1 Tax=Neisseria subflava TaxID=28449 RepID=UPI001C99B5B6|nr:KilA-N domain-containing protein [Neisseria subflava]MBY6286220.1 KilA-N domain-containing protein [Neisseria subflava]